jgi:predicted  nucleic acid-binding Zn-ribbon protein
VIVLIFITKNRLGRKEYKSIKDIPNLDEDKIFVEFELTEYKKIVAKVKSADTIKNQAKSIIESKDKELQNLINEKDEQINRLNKTVSNLKEAVGRWKNKASGKKKIRQFKPDFKLLREEHFKSKSNIIHTSQFETNFTADIPYSQAQELIDSFVGQKYNEEFYIFKIDKVYKINKNDNWIFNCTMKKNRSES